MIDVLLLTVGAGMTIETRQGLKPRKSLPFRGTAEAMP